MATKSDDNFRNSREWDRFFDAVPDPLLMIWAMDGRLLAMNAAARAEFGYGPAELSGLSVWDLSAEPEATRASFLTLRTLPRLKVVKRLYRRKDGSEFPVEINAAAYDAPEGRVVVSVIRNVSERATAEKALADSEGRFREMAGAISQVFWMTDAAKTRMLYVSPGYETIWGRSCESLYADPAGWLEAILPEDRGRVAAAAAGQGRGEVYDVVYRIRRPDGAIRWIRDRGYPVRDEAGAILRVTGAATDITEQQRIQEELLESRAFLEEAQEIASLGSWEYALGPATVRWSRECCRLMGVSPGGLRSVEDFYALVHPDDADEQRRIMDAFVAGAAPVYASEFRVVRPDGAVRWLASRGRMIRDERGAPQRMIGVVQDVTESKQAAEKLRLAEEQLRQAQKMEAVGRLAGGVAHDFNNILTTVLGLSEMAIQSLPESSPLKADLEEIRQAGYRASGLTQQLLAFSRRQIVAPRYVEADQTVSGLAKMLRRVIGEDVELRLSPAAAGAVVLADPVQIEQVVLNLAVNARDAMPEGGRLIVATSVRPLEAGEAAASGLRPGRHVELVVADTGHGMTEAVKAHIFEPFFTTKAHGKGTGLGLATVYGIVKQSGGAIACESAAGRGATFRILLPLQDRPADPDRRDPAGPAPRGKGTVLVVEDEPAVRRLMERVLGGLGYRVESGTDGEDGLRRLQEDAAGRIRLLVTDMVMPKMGGRKLAEAAARVRPDLRVLFTSGYTDDVIGVQTAVDIGASFLRKPFTPRELADRVAEALEAAR